VAAAAVVVLPTERAAAKATLECAGGGVKVAAGASPATVTVTDTTTGSGVQVRVTITGTSFAVAPVDSAVTLAGATWCLKASTKTQNGTGTAGASTIANGKGVTQAIGYLVVYGVTSQAVSGDCTTSYGVNASGHATIHFLVQDDSGLETIGVTDIVNATYTITDFFAGTTGYVEVLATRTIEGVPMSITFVVTTGAGAQESCSAGFPRAT
jgi:hypothetical protein